MDMPRSIAIDASTNRVYWANSSSPAITYVNGSEGGSVFTDGIETDNLQGIAIDPIAQRVFWGSPENDTLGFASFTEGGPLGLLDTTGATASSPAWPVLLYAPRHRRTDRDCFPKPDPRILRKPKPGRPLVPLVASHTATLSCSQGSWAGDLLESFLYRAPQRISLSVAAKRAADSRGDRELAGRRPTSRRLHLSGDRVQRRRRRRPRTAPRINISASLRLGKAVLNAREGDRQDCESRPPAPASSTLSGKGVKPNKLKSKPGSTAPLRGTLVLKTRGKARTKLESDGGAKVRVRISYTPTNGIAADAGRRSFSLRLAAG